MKMWYLLITCILKTFYHINFIFHILIGLYKDMTHIDLKLIGSKVKVRRIPFVKYGCFSLLENVYYRDIIIHTFIGLDEC